MASIAACTAAWAGAASIGASQEIPSPPAAMQHGWFRYHNARFGLRVDLPDAGFVRDLSPGGSGITLTSPDRAITIAVHANWTQSILPDATASAAQSVAQLLEQAIAKTRQHGGSVTYTVRHDDFYVVSGYLGGNVYYERLAISPACPHVFDAVRLTYPQAIEHTLEPVVTRVSLSLRAVCPTPAG